MDFLRDIRQNGVTHLLLLGGAFIFLTFAYVLVQETYTKVRCVNKGYPVSYWSNATGGVCTKVENGNTILVHVDSLRNK